MHRETQTIKPPRTTHSPQEAECCFGTLTQYHLYPAKNKRREWGRGERKKGEGDREKERPTEKMEREREGYGEREKGRRERENIDKTWDKIDAQLMLAFS